MSISIADCPDSEADAAVVVGGEGGVIPESVSRA